MYEQRQAGVEVMMHVTIACVTARMTGASLPINISLQQSKMQPWSTMADQLACAAARILVLC